MTDAARSGVSRGVALLGTLLVCIAVIAGASPVPGGAAPVPVDVPAFATQQASIADTVVNFWGAAVEPARQEPYVEAPGSSRRVQYFDKARMEDAPTGVTNGLLTAELISGQRQTGDTRFAAFPPCALPVVGDLDNKFPTYRALNAKVFPERTGQNGDAVDLVYKSDGSFTHDAKLGAQPGAAAGDYASDPGGRYAHNIPAAFWQYLTALPMPWQTAMGFPLTEAFWVNVRVRGALVWVLVQPFERRVLSYTPDNAPGFQVEMGNIGQHYFQWRYALAPDTSSPSASAVATDTGSGDGTGTPAAVVVPVISGVRFGLASSNTASLAFQTDVPATSRIRFGTASHSYQTSQEIALAPTHDHRVTLSGLAPKTKYYFVLHAETDTGTSESKEGYFATAPTNATVAAGAQDASGNPAPDAQPTATATPRPTKETATPKPTPGTPRPAASDASTATDTPRLPTTTDIPRTATATDTPRPPTATDIPASPTATDTPRPPTATDTPRPPTTTSTPRPPSATDTAPMATNSPTPIPTAVPNIIVTITQFAVGSDGSSLDIVQTDAAALGVTLTDTVSADTQHTAITPRNWSVDTANTRIVAADARTSLTLRGRQNPVTVRFDVSVPLRDHGTLAFTVTQTIAPNEYQAGKTYTFSKGTVASPGYHADIQFTVSQG